MSVNISNNLETLFGRMENFISTKTVIGEAIHIGNVIIVPVVDVSFAIGAGAVEDIKEKDTQETNGGVLGGKITPSAVLVIVDGSVQLVNIKNQDSLNKLIDMVPGIAAKLNLSGLFNKKEKTPKDGNPEKPTDGMPVEEPFEV
ncbi:MAG: sporulation protein [Clostridiales bacterium]|jgi:uncharacterized spore protein YtfJ|nr:sporulation protein [Clostridiales bacterium]